MSGNLQSTFHTMEPARTWIGDLPMYPNDQPFTPSAPFQPYSWPPVSPAIQHGCICPPGSEQTCRGDYCPRQPMKPLNVTSGSTVTVNHEAQGTGYDSGACSHELQGRRSQP